MTVAVSTLHLGSARMTSGSTGAKSEPRGIGRDVLGSDRCRRVVPEKVPPLRACTPLSYKADDGNLVDEA